MVNKSINCNYFLSKIAAVQVDVLFLKTKYASEDIRISPFPVTKTDLI